MSGERKRGAEMSEEEESEEERRRAVRGKTSFTSRAGSLLFSKVMLGISTRNVGSNWIEEGK